jgi:anti-anti-sigma factor
MLKIDIGPQGEVRLAGRLDAVQAPAAEAALEPLQGIVTLDCTDLEYISSAGLGVFLKTHKRVAAGGGRVRLAGLRHHVRDILRYSGFDAIFEIVPADGNFPPSRL